MNGELLAPNEITRKRFDSKSDFGSKWSFSHKNERNRDLAREDRSDEKLFQCRLLNRWCERENGEEWPTYRSGVEANLQTIV